jgi:2-deoxy-D-gluconate 3-dehydrogenase
MGSATLFDLTGRVALVTGGNSGIGLGLARGLAGAGASVMVAGRSAEKNAAAVAELHALGAEAETVTAEMTEPAAIEAMVAATVARFGKLDVLVANAGTSVRKAPQEITLEEWRRVIDTNLTSTMLCCQAAYPHLKRSDQARIITNGSMLSIFGTSFAAAYGASKGGVMQLTRSLAVAWAPDGITVNCILPGWIDTDLTRGARAQVAGLHEKVLARSPMGRWGTPSDFEGVAVFLASAASAFLTGTAIPVDGGFSVQG